ncbi:MAG: hypothetical protein QNJ51_27310 [Calothrix sp. MO_167.B12]|nr:hypothetical protein [Calothrix sp. MO_167.B12]
MTDSTQTSAQWWSRSTKQVIAFLEYFHRSLAKNIICLGELSVGKQTSSTAIFWFLWRPNEPNPSNQQLSSSAKC